MANTMTNGFESKNSKNVIATKVHQSPEDPTIDILRKPSVRSNTSNAGLALYGESSSDEPTLAAFLRTFTIPGTAEKDASDANKKKANMGVIIGVYLPTVQHIFGVIMFLRLFWIVGIAGIGQALAIVVLCCLCTFLTTISMSAIATNGVVESGGSYFMISRNMGPEFGTAIGILFYFANSVACGMYLIGSAEILLEYMTNGELFVGKSGDKISMLYNNFRLYGTVLLVIMFVIVACGVRVVQLFAPITLSCVIISVLAIYAGGFAALICPSCSPQICLVGNRLLRYDAWHSNNTASCNSTSDVIRNLYCLNETDWSCDPYYLQHRSDIKPIYGIPGYSSKTIYDNFGSRYMSDGEAAPGEQGNKAVEVVQDITTTFFILLAVYFPSVTGIMTGANMSGDLKNPQYSIPLGTIAAQLTTSLVYISFVFVFGGSIHHALLSDKFGISLHSHASMVVAALSWPSPWVLLIGSFTSTVGAGLQCLCSAPRLLQSIAKDDVLPFLNVFSVVTKHNEPFRALLLTTLISECAILIGAIESIAPVVDFFFLMCYAFVNIVCAMQTLMHAPNWRPRFRFYHWSLSLLGAFLCLFIMFSTYWYYTLAVLLLCAIIYKYVDYRGAKKEWGDGMRGLALSAAQYSLYKIEESEPHPKNWRPQLLVLIKPSALQSDRRMLTLASHLKAGKGLTIVTSIMEGDYSSVAKRKEASEKREELKKMMSEEKMKGFSNVLVSVHSENAVSTIVQVCGIGGLRPNTIMVCFPSNWKVGRTNDSRYWEILDSIHRVASAKMCLLMPKNIENFPNQNDRITGFIDVWWIISDGGLLILLSYLLRQHKVWKQCKTRVFAVAQLHDNSIKMKQDLEKWCYQLRIDASVEIVELSDQSISAYSYERTLRMQEREAYLKSLHLSLKEKHSEPQLLLEKLRAVSQENLRRVSLTTPTTINRSGSTGKDITLNSRSVQFKKVSVSGADALAKSEETTPLADALSKSSDDSEEDPEYSGGNVKIFIESATDSDGTPLISPKAASQFTFSPQDKRQHPSILASEKQKTSVANAGKALVNKSVDKAKVKKMHSAVNINQIIRKRSSSAALVVVNLPRPPRKRDGFPNYLEYLEVLCEGLSRVLLVRGSGFEVITMYT